MNIYEFMEKAEIFCQHTYDGVTYYVMLPHEDHRLCETNPFVLAAVVHEGLDTVETSVLQLNHFPSLPRAYNAYEKILLLTSPHQSEIFDMMMNRNQRHPRTIVLDTTGAKS